MGTGYLMELLHSLPVQLVFLWVTEQFSSQQKSNFLLFSTGDSPAQSSWEVQTSLLKTSHIQSNLT